MYTIYYIYIPDKTDVSPLFHKAAGGRCSIQIVSFGCMLVGLRIFVIKKASGRETSEELSANVRQCLKPTILIVLRGHSLSYPFFGAETNSHRDSHGQYFDT